MFTRKDYLDNKCTHQEYYDQFVNDKVKQLVLRHIGKDALLNSTDEVFNDIPLKKWDDLVNVTPGVINMKSWKEAEPTNQANSYFWSLSSNVCILKAAARQIKAELTSANQSNPDVDSHLETNNKPKTNKP